MFLSAYSGISPWNGGSAGQIRLSLSEVARTFSSDALSAPCPEVWGLWGSQSHLLLQCQRAVCTPRIPGRCQYYIVRIVYQCRTQSGNSKTQQISTVWWIAWANTFLEFKQKPPVCHWQVRHQLLQPDWLPTTWRIWNSSYPSPPCCKWMRKTLWIPYVMFWNHHQLTLTVVGRGQLGHRLHILFSTSCDPSGGELSVDPHLSSHLCLFLS